MLCVAAKGADTAWIEAVAGRLVGLGARRDDFAGATLLVRPDTPLMIHDRGGCAVLGTLFRRADNSLVESLNGGLGYSIGASGGRHLISNFWGGYVALLATPGGHDLSCFRDPSGVVPVYRLGIDGGCLAFSDLSLLRDAGMAMPAFDWTGLAHHLRFPFLRTAMTGLAGVREILPGQRVDLQDDLSQSVQLWSPSTFTGVSVVPMAEAAADVERVISSTTRALSDRFGRLQLELSGGLDSSILATCLAERQHPWQCLTFATHATDGDERPFARAVTNHIGVALEEIFLDASIADPLIVPTLPRVRPGGFSVLAGSDAVLLKHARDFGADAIFSGAGGDNVFCMISSASPVLDALRQRGISGAWVALADVARLNETTGWDAFVHAVRQARREWAGRSPWRADDRYLGDAGRVAFAGHPWLDGTDKRLPGKISHIAAMLRFFPFLDGYDRALHMPVICPLMAQPVMETCLAIPSWQWISGGRDRAVARQAFAHRLPPLVRHRRTKGDLESVFVPAYLKARHGLRTLLAHGQLAANGIIDRQALDRAFDEGIVDRDAGYTRLLEIADVELWIRSIDGFR
jgi:asparagine synthase (glutamine-hydrolysing)